MNKVINITPWIALIGAMIGFGCAKEDLSSIPRSEIFIKYYGSERGDQVIDIVKFGDDASTPTTEVDRYFVLGTRISEFGDKDAVMILTDSAGNRMWERVVDFSDDQENRDSDDVPSSVLLSQDNSKAWVIGTSYYGTSIKESIMLIHINIADGQIENDTTFQYYDDRPNDLGSFSHVESRGAALLEEGSSLIVLGSVKSGITERDESNAYSIFMASIVNDANLFSGSYQDMTINWRQFDGFNTGNDYGVKLLFDGANYFYVASIELPDVNRRNDVMIKWFDPVDGNEISDARIVGTSANDFPTNIVDDGADLVITGSSGEKRSERAFFLSIPKNLTEDGIFQLVESAEAGEGSSLTGGGEGSNASDEGNTGQDVVKLEDGNFFIVGTLKNYTNEEGILKQDEIVISKVNGLGELIEGSVRVYGSDQPDQGNSIWLNKVFDPNLGNNGGENVDVSIVIGGTVGFGGTAKLMALIKTNVEGELKR